MLDVVMTVHAFIHAPSFWSPSTSCQLLPLRTSVPSIHTHTPHRNNLRYHTRHRYSLPYTYISASAVNSDSPDNKSSDESPSKLEPVEDGVALPDAPDAELQVQASWLEIELRSWLDGEWQEKTAWESHREIAHKTSRTYARLRSEGMHDCTSLLLAIGEQLEGLDFSKTYTGPWNVANKTADLLMHRFAPDRFAGDGDAVPTAAAEQQHSVGTKDENPYVAVQQAEAEAKARNSAWIASEDDEDVSVDVNGDNVLPRRPASPNLADEFERYRFLQMVLEGTASKVLVDGAIALAVGFEYDIKTGVWTGREVTDPHFRTFGDNPPDVLGDEKSPEWTSTLIYLLSQVELDDEDGRVKESLQVILETLHGVEMLRIQENDKNDHAFKKRVVAVKWLHLRGGF